MIPKYVYVFGGGRAEGSGQMKDLLGGKGANLAEMTNIGLPVPAGFTITTEACNAYFKAGARFPEGLWEQVIAALRQVEAMSGKGFGNPSDPLLVSCRSGAKFSMPGMMDTVLNIGLNDETALGLITLTSDERVVYDAYRRLVHMFGSVVLGIPDEPFEDALTQLKERRQAAADTDLTAQDLIELTAIFKKIVWDHKGFEFPSDPFEQMRLAIEAVFKSWNGKRAVDYRNAAGIPHDLGTAVNIVTMVFGNMGWDSGTGVAFTRDPATGEKVLYGDYLLNAQGEDVVAGIRNTKKIQELERDLPEVFQQFVDICQTLERHYRDMQDIEFTIERGKLWVLQTRNGKRTARAAIKIAVDMANEGLITRREALMRVSPDDVDNLLHPQFDPAAKQEAAARGRFLARGVNASPGAAVGMVTFDADTAEAWGKEGKDVVMVRPFTKPDDVHGMLKARGILTSEGGATSHAAVVARQFGVPCVVGASSVVIEVEQRFMSANGMVVREGDWISLDGATGEVFVGQIPTIRPQLEEEKDLLTLLTWADEVRRLQVWANADYPEDAARARAFGAQGIGLCRTEHMFFEEERLPIVRRMILATDEDERAQALAELLPFQREDFEGIFQAMDGLPVIIRLLDPPLHEFLPQEDEDIRLLASEMGMKFEDLKNIVRNLHELNPMMGHRG
ncbi:MAG: pyruvate, phosphate dikinase, partial [candidate division WOR-3 bacterium]